MKKLLLISIIFICFIHNILFTQEVIETLSGTETDGKAISISIEDGNAWSSYYEGIKQLPQIAIWLEDDSGKFIETLYVTAFFGQQKIGNFNIPNIVFGRGTLPLWIGRQYTGTGSYPTRNKPIPDSITKATPKARFTLNTRVPSNIKSGQIYIEVDLRGDSNSSYPDAVYGQPSIVYRADVDFSKTGRTFEFERVGSTLKDDEGHYLKGLEGITTAKNIIRNATVLVK